MKDERVSTLARALFCAAGGTVSAQESDRDVHGSG
jgi:hypothetical protein